MHTDRLRWFARDTVGNVNQHHTRNMSPTNDSGSDELHGGKSTMALTFHPTVDSD